MVPLMGNMWSIRGLGSTIASILFFHTLFERYIPRHLRIHLRKCINRFTGFMNPYIQIVFQEHTGERLERSRVYTAIRNYLSHDSSKQARRLKGDLFRDSKKLVLSMDDYEEITDSFEGAKLWWVAGTSTVRNERENYNRPSDIEKRYYKLSFHRKHRELVTDSYLKHVLEEGRKIAIQNRQRKLYTNNRSDNLYRSRDKLWSHVLFDHPATFRTLAMDPEKKKDIIDDLITFSKGKDYYADLGKPWKRGYLLYGPPGTGKSTMVAAMANLLEYDVYDLELTAVKDNTELRRLLIEISSKSIIVIEDIDCSLDLTSQRKKEREEDEEDAKDDEEKKDRKTKMVKKEEIKTRDSKVTLSGLLNFIDGLWSACGGERIIVFTTNHVDQLDPALIRRGRMDKHIELSYCTFEAFKDLAKIYLKLDSHELFEPIRQLLAETQMTPADVAENLTPKTVPRNAETCLESLIQALKDAKEEARLKAEEEEKKRAIKREKEKKQREAATKEGKSSTTPKDVKMNGKDTN